MSGVWFTSDLHFGHGEVAELRGFGSTAEHDGALADSWNAAVTKRDQVWVLGDLSLSKVDHALAIIDSLPGEKHFITGNHDPCHPMHRDSHKWQRRYLEVFGSVQAFSRRKIDGRDVLLSHFPYDGDHTYSNRYMQFRLRDEGGWLLHGHTHGTERLHDDRQIHVGVDAWNLRPVRIDVVAGLMS